MLFNYPLDSPLPKNCPFYFFIGGIWSLDYGAQCVGRTTQTSSVRSLTGVSGPVSRQLWYIDDDSLWSVWGAGRQVDPHLLRSAGDWAPVKLGDTRWWKSHQEGCCGWLAESGGGDGGPRKQVAWLWGASSWWIFPEDRQTAGVRVLVRGSSLTMRLWLTTWESVG